MKSTDYLRIDCKGEPPEYHELPKGTVAAVKMIARELGVPPGAIFWHAMDTFLTKRGRKPMPLSSHYAKDLRKLRRAAA